MLRRTALIGLLALGACSNETNHGDEQGNVPPPSVQTPGAQAGAPGAPSLPGSAAQPGASNGQAPSGSNMGAQPSTSDGNPATPDDLQNANLPDTDPGDDVAPEPDFDVIIPLDE